MAITINVELKKKLTVDCPFDDVFDTLADVPYSASHFPRVEELVDQGDECYRWEMEKVGVDRWFIQTVYTSEYTWDKDEGVVEWFAVEDEGTNAIVDGGWKLKELKDGKTRIDFHTSAELTVPLPRLAKVIVTPIVKREFESMFDEYISNLKATWGC